MRSSSFSVKALFVELHYLRIELNAWFQTMMDMSSSFVLYRSRKRFGNLDGLRFICILMVLWHHAPFSSLELPQFFTRGFLGVDFFFVLSGFLITTLLLREAGENGRFSMRNFYLRRILRILPVYFFVITCVSAYYVLVSGQDNLAPLVPYYYLFLSNFLVEHIPTLGITWSLSVEEQYYVLWPLLLMILPRRLLVPTCLILVFVNVACAMGVFGLEPVAYRELLIRLPNATYAPILLGSLAAIFLHRQESFNFFYRLVGYRYASLCGFLVLILFLNYGPMNVLGLPNLFIHLTMTFILMGLVVREDTPLTPMLTNSFVVRAGAVSYGIYLYHLIVLDVVNRTAQSIGGLSHWAVFFTYSILSFLVAEVSFRTLEAYFTRFRR